MLHEDCHVPQTLNPKPEKGPVKKKNSLNPNRGIFWKPPTSKGLNPRGSGLKVRF